MIEVRQYETEAGVCPFAGWFDALDARSALKVRATISRMETGNLGDCKPVGDGVLERRIDWGPGYRLYFGRDGDAVVVLLAGGTKRRQQADIAAAKQYWLDYRKRKRGETGDAIDKKLQGNGKGSRGS
jgi:putative addiction module killer protein